MTTSPKFSVPAQPTFTLDTAYGPVTVTWQSSGGMYLNFPQGALINKVTYPSASVQVEVRADGTRYAVDSLSRADWQKRPSEAAQKAVRTFALEVRERELTPERLQQARVFELYHAGLHAQRAYLAAVAELKAKRQAFVELREAYRAVTGEETGERAA